MSYLPITNMNPETGIRYGVIPQNDVLQAWCDSSEPWYFPGCPHCGDEIDQEIIDSACNDFGEVRCPHCNEVLNSGDFGNEEPTCYYVDDGETVAECGESGDIFVTSSKFFTFAPLCSPCALGACYLRDANEYGEKSYCLGHDWFDDGVAPYPVYSVETGELVNPEK